ncbi:hypothetical protein PE066_17865 [Ramlibacter tataouinensis]|uniref:hypothetical protein n=1 Tax=Ramlibacter tataouinensis TaxID=94132 RepID=UPI0022F3F01B|nr:hypothetical protein [Ramlibacter tataouinensis]WBY01307.1 hypothetical protein PE066_17865 [Ramlibacter tataouinensis]
MPEQTDPQRREIQALILDRMADLIQADARAAAIAMATASLGLLARLHPPELSVPDSPGAVLAKHRAVGAINRALEQAVAEGISPVAAVSLAIRTAVARAAEFNLHPFQVIRPLIEGMRQALQRLAHHSASEREEAAVTALARQLGISRSQARERLRHVGKP